MSNTLRPMSAREVRELEAWRAEVARRRELAHEEPIGPVTEAQGRQEAARARSMMADLRRRERTRDKAKIAAPVYGRGAAAYMKEGNDEAAVYWAKKAAHAAFIAVPELRRTR